MSGVYNDTEDVKETEKKKKCSPKNLENSSSARRDKQQIVGRSCAEESSEKFRVSDDQEKAPDATDQSPS